MVALIDPWLRERLKPEIQEEYSEAERKLGLPSGIAPSGVPSDARARELSRAADEARKAEISKQIESQRRQSLFEAGQRYREDLRGIHDISQRQQRLVQYQQEIAQTQQQYSQARLQAGIITGYIPPVVTVPTYFEETPTGRIPKYTPPEAYVPPEVIRRIPERPEVIRPDLIPIVTPTGERRFVSRTEMMGIPYLPPEAKEFIRTLPTPVGAEVVYPPVERPIGERTVRRLAKRFPFLATLARRARAAEEFLERKIPRPRLREGEIVYGVEGKIVGRALPYGMTPFSRGVDWFRVVEGRVVPIERPDTVVGAISEAVYGVAEELPQIGPEVEITPELYDLPGQLGLMYFFSPAISQIKYKKGKAKLKLKTIKKGKKVKIDYNELIRNWREKLIREPLGKQELRERLIKAYESGNKNTIRQAENLVRDLLGRDATSFVIDAKGQAVIPLVEKPIPKIPVEFPVELPPEVITGIYAGLGIYDVPEQVLAERLAREARLAGKPLEEYGIIRPEFRPAVAEIAKVFVKPEPKFKELTFLGAAVAPVTATAAIQRQRLREAQKEVLKQREKLQQASWTGLASISALGLATPTIQKTKLRYGIPTVPIPKIPRVPRIPKIPRLLPPPIKLFDFLPRRRIRRRPIRPPKPLFIPEVRRKGKWIPITAPVPLLKAVTVGKRRVERTLAASLRIRGPRGIVPLVPFGPKWRRAKKEPFVLVEKRKYRLDVPSEVSEILAAKKRKGKTKKKKGKKVNFFS